MNKFLMPAALLLGLVFIGGAILWNGSNPITPAGQQPISLDIADVNTENVPFIGDLDAPVSIAFWSDFQCPYCRASEIGHPQLPTIEPALPQIIEKYVATGKVKIFFKDVAFLGSDSQDAAEYSLAVWNMYPDRWFEWREAMFEAQDEEHAGFGNADSIDLLNSSIGLDADAIRADIVTNGSVYKAQVADATSEAGKLGVRATPSFVVNTTFIEGAQGFSAFEPVIEAELN